MRKIILCGAAAVGLMLGIDLSAHVVAGVGRAKCCDALTQADALKTEMIWELQQMRLEYQRATDPNRRAALRSEIRDRMSGRDLGSIRDPGLREFIYGILRGDRG